MMTSIAVTAVDSALYDRAKHLAQNLNLTFVTTMSEAFSVYLVVTPERLELQMNSRGAPGPVYVDFLGGSLGHRSRFGGGRRQLIGRAVGIAPKKTLRVLDVTAGLGRDAFVLAHLGCDVTMLESSPIIAALLRDGLERAAAAPQFKTLKLHFVETEAVQYMQQLKEEDYPDVIYVDPMFPPLKKSAAVKKEMRVLRQVVKTHDNTAELFTLACRIAKKRVVVKRHRHAPCLTDTKPDLVFSGKSSRFDVYITRQL